MTALLHINSSARYGTSASRQLTARLIERFDVDTVVERDLADGVEQYTDRTMGAVFAPRDLRTEEQHTLLAAGHELIDEMRNADVVVIGLPIYNFGPPATLKAWADQIARAGETFEYSETGPRGLLADRPVYVVVASGGVPIGSGMDFSSTWLTTFLNFLGIHDITVVPAGQLNVDPEHALDQARERVDTVELPMLVG